MVTIFKIPSSNPSGCSKGGLALLHNAAAAIGVELPVRCLKDGSAVGMAYAAAVDYLQCVQLATKGVEGGFRATASEPIQILSRIEVGKRALGKSQGSIGQWGRDAVVNFGVLPMGVYKHGRRQIDLTSYNAAIVEEFGDSKIGLPPKMEKEAGRHRVQGSLLVCDYSTARSQLCAGNPIVFASNQGFELKRGERGFCKPEGQWAHCLVGIGVDDDDSRPGVLLYNPWGDYLKGPKRHNQPIGSFWADAEVIDKMTRHGDSYSIWGFPPYTE